MRKLALVIGIGQYANENNLPNATNHAQDYVDRNKSCQINSLVYFYDHNYLIPSDNLGINDIDLSTRAINAQDVLHCINSRKPLATIFILDCCRRYHLRYQHLDRRPRAEAINQNKGLREMSNEHESLVVFACATADDQITGRNGLFTKHLPRHIHSPNEPVEMMLTDVIYGVKQESKSEQIPYIYSSLSNKRLFLNETTVVKFSYLSIS